MVEVTWWDPTLLSWSSNLQWHISQDAVMEDGPKYITVKRPGYEVKQWLFEQTGEWYSTAHFANDDPTLTLLLLKFDNLRWEK